MRISFLPAQLRQGIAKQTSVPDDLDVVPSQPGSEIIVAPIINEVWDERGKFFRRVHRHLEHLRILPKGGRILSESKKPQHRQTRLGFSAELKGLAHPRNQTSSYVSGISCPRRCACAVSTAIVTALRAPNSARVTSYDYPLHKMSISNLLFYHEPDVTPSSPFIMGRAIGIQQAVPVVRVCLRDKF